MVSRDGQSCLQRFVGGVVFGKPDETSADDEEQSNLRERVVGKLDAYSGAGLLQQSFRGQRFGRLSIGEN